MIRFQHSGAIVVVLCLLAGCDVKGGLSAYLHKTDAAPEPAAGAVVLAPNAGVLTAPSSTPSPAYVGSAVEPSPAATVAVAATPPKTTAASASAAPPPSSSAAPYAAKIAPAAPVPAPAPAPVSVASTAPLATAAPAVPPPVPQVKTTGERNVSVGGSAVSGGNVSNAARVIAGLRRPLRDCYARDTTATEGSMRFTIKVGPTGAVSGLSVQPSAPFSSQLMACTTSVIRAAKFDPPETGAAQIMVPATFVAH